MAEKYEGRHRAKKGHGGTMKDGGPSAWRGGSARSASETRGIPKLTKKKMQAEDDQRKHGKS